jgi:histone deacetylase complex regulatory component SIN3
MFIPHQTQGDIVLYVSMNFYTLLRFFYTLYERILLARIKLREIAEKELEKYKEDTEKYGGLMTKIDQVIEERCILVSKALIGIQQGSESTAYEEFLRKAIGSQSYILFTFDKALSSCSKQI